MFSVEYLLPSSCCLIKFALDWHSNTDLIIAKNEYDHTALARLALATKGRNSPLPVVLDRQIRDKYSHALNLLALGILSLNNSIKLYWYDTEIRKEGFFKDIYYDGLVENKEDLLELATMYFDMNRFNRNFYLMG
jgi:hypothetical protein